MTRASQFGSRRRILALIAIVFGVSAALATLPALRDFGIRLTDSYLRTVPPPRTPPRPVLVLIDDESMAAEGRWPWSRTKLADMIHALSQAGAKVIGLDILLSEPQSPAADDQLANAMRESKRVVLVDKIASYGDGQVRWVEPLRDFMSPDVSLGHAQAVLDSDGVCRRFPPIELSVDGERWAFAIEVARRADESSTADFLSHYDAGRANNAKLVVAKPDLIPIAYRTGGFLTISAADVLRGRKLDLVRGRPVLIGFGSSDLGDRVTTPLTTAVPAPGVEVHAQILDSVLSGRMLKPVPQWTSYLLLLLASALAVVLFRTVRRWTAVFVTLAFAFAVYLAGWTLYALTAWMLNPGPLLISLVLAPIVVQADHLFEVNRSLAQQVDDMRSWLRSHRHGSPLAGGDDLTENVGVLQQLQTELGSLYELHNSLLQASSDAIGVFHGSGALLLQNGSFAQLFDSSVYGSTLEQVRSQLRWTNESPEIVAARGSEGEAHVGDELYAVRTVELAATRIAPGGGVLMLLTSLKTREERDASRAEALGFVTHELRTPLTAIQGFAELMMRHPESPMVSNAPGIIFRESKRLLALIHSYLDVLRMDAGTRPIQPSNFNIRELVDNVLQVLRPAAEDARMKLQWEGDPETILYADRPLIEGAMLNLVANAIKYGTPGGKIEVSWKQAHDEVQLTVRNPSENLPDSELPSMFAAFRRADNVQSKPGWGIGLALVKRIAEKHGGSVTASSHGGTVSFTIFVPVQPQAVMAAEATR